VQPTALIGREAELAVVRRQLREADRRLVTLTGPAGVGKTRLALAVAETLLDDFRDGVHFVSLAPLTDPDLVFAAIAQVVGVPEARGRSRTQGVIANLRGKQVLLVLDNFEHLLTTAPGLAELLAGCPEVKLLATSRASLRLRWEHEQPVLPLALPEEGRMADLEAVSRSAAVALFVQRAEAVRPEFALAPADAPTVAAICRRLDGLPLAIELAAARIRVLSPQELLARLEHSLAVLTGGARDLPTRQQTLQQAIAWSYDLLTTGEQALFRWLGIFSGGCTLEAVECVCQAAGGSTADAFEGLASLLDMNLVQRVETRPGEARFTMLQTIREFALERLAAARETKTVRRWHMEYFLGIAEEAEPRLRGRESYRWLTRLEDEHGNLRAALACSLTDAAEAETGLRLAGALSFFWMRRGYHSEGRMWLGRAHRCSSDRARWRRVSRSPAG